MTKNKKARKVQGRRGDIFEKIKEFSNYTSPNDYIFVDNNSGQQLGRDYYYKAWKHMMKLSGLDKGIKHMSFYNLRHTYATWRLYLPNVNIRALCENLGTGLQYLEEHYGQVKTQVERERLTADLPDEVKEDLLEYG
jgi:integrase